MLVISALGSHRQEEPWRSMTNFYGLTNESQLSSRDPISKARCKVYSFREITSVADLWHVYTHKCMHACAHIHTHSCMGNHMDRCPHSKKICPPNGGNSFPLCMLFSQSGTSFPYLVPGVCSVRWVNEYGDDLGFGD